MSKRYRLVIDGKKRVIWDDPEVAALTTVADVRAWLRGTKQREFAENMRLANNTAVEDILPRLDGPDVETIDVEEQDFESAPFVPLRRIKGPPLKDLTFARRDGTIHWPAPGSHNTYIPSWEAAPHLTVDAADLPDEVVGAPVKNAIRDAAARLRERGVNKFSEVKPTDPISPRDAAQNPTVDIFRQSVAAALRARVTALYRAAAELEALVPLAEDLVPGSPAENAFWSLLSTYRPNG